MHSKIELCVKIISIEKNNIFKADKIVSVILMNFKCIFSRFCLDFQNQ